MKGKISKGEIRALKRSLLGFFGSSAVKSLEEISLALVKVGIANSYRDAKIITPQLIGKSLNYSLSSSLNIREREYDYSLPSNESDVAEYEVVVCSDSSC